MDETHQRVYRLIKSPSEEQTRIELLFEGQGHLWTRLTADAEGRIYLLDRKHREINVYHVETTQFEESLPIQTHPAHWQPRDITFYNGNAIILDSLQGRVYVYRPDRKSYEFLFEDRTATWEQIAYGPDAQIYLLSNAEKMLAIYSPSGNWLAGTTPVGYTQTQDGRSYRLGPDDPWLMRYDRATGKSRRFKISVAWVQPFGNSTSLRISRVQPQIFMWQRKETVVSRSLIVNLGYCAIFRRTLTQMAGHQMMSSHKVRLPIFSMAIEGGLSSSTWIGAVGGLDR